MEASRSRKSKITPEMVNLTCALQEDERHHLSQVRSLILEQWTFSMLYQVTALYMACMLNPNDSSNTELVKLLIKAGADPNIPAVMTCSPDPEDSDSDDGWVPAQKHWSPLILAVRQLDLNFPLQFYLGSRIQGSHCEGVATRWGQDCDW